jgi:hypothetical protein
LTPLVAAIHVIPVVQALRPLHHSDGRENDKKEKKQASTPTEKLFAAMSQQALHPRAGDARHTSVGRETRVFEVEGRF